MNDEHPLSPAPSLKEGMEDLHVSSLDSEKSVRAAFTPLEVREMERARGMAK